MSTPPPPPSYPQGGYGPPPGPPPVPTGKPKLRGRIPLRLSLIFGVVGVVLCVVGIVVLVTGTFGKTGDFPRVALDGSPHSVQLTRTGQYVGYFEAPGLDSTDSAPTGRLLIRGPSGEVEFRRPGVNQTYDVNGRVGISVVEFTISQAGEYTFTGTGGSDFDRGQLAIGESITGSLVTGVLLFIPGLLLVIAAIVLLIVGLVKRSRHKRELASGYVGGHGPNYYTGQ